MSFLLRSDTPRLLLRYQRLPSWLRWLLLFPIAVAAWFLVQLPIAFLTSIGTLPESWKDPASQLANSIIPAFFLVWLAAVLAPRAPFVVALTVTVLHALLVGSLIGIRLVSKIAFSDPAWWLILSGVLGIITTVFVMLGVHRDASQVPGA